MEFRNYNVYFFFIILLVISVLAFLIVRPFWAAILMAAVLAVVFYKPYKLILSRTGSRKFLSSFLTCLLVAVVTIVPLVFILEMVAFEANNLYRSLSAEEVRTGFGVFKERIGQTPILNLLGIEALLTRQNFLDSLKGVGDNAFSIVQIVYQSILSVVLWFLITLLTLFFFLVYGKELAAKILALSPIKNRHEEMLINKFISISRATLKGSIIVAVVQGIIGGTTFAIAGVPSPIVWGVLMGIFSLVPMFGTGLIWFPTALVLLVMGQIWQAVFILVMGFMVISTADNIVRAKLVGKDVQMHPLMVFFATLGGIKFFGPVGIIIGPIIIALFLALWEIYGIEFKDQLEEYNK